MRDIYLGYYKYDSGLEFYNLFNSRSKLIGEEQPHSIFYMDKFSQPTHLYMHSNMNDYPVTRDRENITKSSDWDQTVVLYEALRTPKFAQRFV